jgi:hypothetical protein
LLVCRRLQLAVFVEHCAAFAADAPAMRRKRRAAANHVTPGHPTFLIAHPRGSRTAWRELREINRISGRNTKAEK